MLTRLHHKALIGYIAFFALMLNAMTQVDCCVSSIAGEHGVPLAAAMDAAPQTHQAQSAGMVMGHDHHEQANIPATGHSGHDAGSCDCKDGLCGQSLIALAMVSDDSFVGAGVGEAWSISAPQLLGHQGARQFQIRAPPVLL